MVIGKVSAAVLLHVFAIMLALLIAVPFTCFLTSCWLDKKGESWMARRRYAHRERLELKRLAGMRV